MALKRLSLLLILVFIALPAIAQTGSLRVRISDDFDGRSFEKSYLLRTVLGAHISLPKALVESIDVVPGGTYVYDREQNTLSLQDSGDSSSSPSSSSHSVLTMRVNFSDKQLPCSVSKISKLLLSGKKNVKDWFLSSSFEQETFEFDNDQDGTADIVTVTIPFSTSGACENQEWADAADDAAEAIGVDPSNYSHVIYVLPSSINCEWGGLAEFGCGANCRAWVAACSATPIYTHELGHTIGLDHATTDSDNDGETDDEYGDTSCPMGTAAVDFRHFNTPHKFQVGWLSSTLSQGITEDGFVSVAASEVDVAEQTETARALRVFINPLQPVLGRYYFTFRSAIGQYSSSLQKTYSNRLNVHRTLDLLGRTAFLTSLGVDESWSDERGRLVTFSDYSDGVATVWASPSGNSQPVFTVSGVLEETNGKSLSEKALTKTSVQIVKLSSKAKQKVSVNEAGSFQASLTYGSYLFQVKSKKKSSIRGAEKKGTTILIDSSTDELVVPVKKRKKRKN